MRPREFSAKPIDVFRVVANTSQILIKRSSLYIWHISRKSPRIRCLSRYLWVKLTRICSGGLFALFDLCFWGNNFPTVSKDVYSLFFCLMVKVMSLNSISMGWDFGTVNITARHCLPSSEGTIPVSTPFSFWLTLLRKSKVRCMLFSVCSSRWQSSKVTSNISDGASTHSF